MNKQKKKKRGKKSVQNLLGLQGFTTYGLKTTGGELVYFAIQPTNISVLSHVNIEIKIRHLLMVLTALPHLEVACLDAAQRFDDNQQFMEQRVRQEDNPKVREALEKDREFLDSIQLEMSTARQFILGLRFKNEKDSQIFSRINDARKALHDEGFEARRMGPSEVKRISYLKDFFRSYKDFTTAQLDTIELMLQKLYRRFDMDDYTDFSQVAPDKFPTMSDFYDLLEEEYDLYDVKKKNLFSEETIQEVCLGLHSMCKGAESKYFNGHTNIKDDKFLVFGVKGIMELNRSLRDALLFSILSYMTNALLGAGNYVGALDELYLFLTNLTAIEYIRNLMKRDRKKDSLLVLASQNIEDFLQPGVRELTKPLFSIPTHQFLFNPGQLEPKAFCDTLQLEQAEFELIRYPERGTCLYRCGNERYLLQVHFPEFKEAMFGKSGGR